MLRASLDGLEPEAMDLLRLAVSLAEAPIPAELAVRTFQERLEGCSRRAAEDRWTRGIEAGQARSLLEIHDQPAPGYTVHALVRRVLAYEPSEQETIAALRAAAVAVMPSMFEGVEDIRNHGRISPVVPHAERLEGARRTPEEATLPFVVAHYHHVRGSFPQSRAACERALEARTRLLGAEHRDTLKTLQNLAGTLNAQGDLTGARKLFERALEAMTRLLGAEHPDTLATLQNLAGTRHAQGDLAGARNLYERALEALTRLLGAEHPDTAMTRFNLVFTLRQLDRDAAAPHAAILARLRARSPESLSAVERRILEVLPALER